MSSVLNLLLLLWAQVGTFVANHFGELLHPPLCRVEKEQNIMPYLVVSTIGIIIPPKSALNVEKNHQKPQSHWSSLVIGVIYDPSYFPILVYQLRVYLNIANILFLWKCHSDARKSKTCNATAAGRKRCPRWHLAALGYPRFHLQRSVLPLQAQHLANAISKHLILFTHWDFNEMEFLANVSQLSPSTLRGFAGLCQALCCQQLLH